MSAFRNHGRGHLSGPVVVIGTGLLGTPDYAKTVQALKQAGK